MEVVLKPTQDFFSIYSGICRYGRVFLLQWRKAAKARRKVREKVWIPVSKLHEICTRKHDHNSVSRFCWEAEGRERSRKRGIRAVLGNHNFEQPPCDDAPWGCGFKGLKSKTGRAGLVFSRISRYLHDRTRMYIYIYNIYIYIYMYSMVFALCTVWKGHIGLGPIFLHSLHAHAIQILHHRKNPSIHVLYSGYLLKSAQ